MALSSFPVRQFVYTLLLHHSEVYQKRPLE